MGKRDRRHSLKMKQRKGQTQKKARIKRLRVARKPAVPTPAPKRASKKAVAAAAPPASSLL